MKHIKFLGIPFSAGQPHRGVEVAPRTLRETGFLRALPGKVLDLGDLDFSLCGERSEGLIKNEKQSALGNALISEAIASEDLRQSFLLCAGGDHGLALGTIHGLLAHYPDMVVIWADAHGDINTPQTSHSGNFHGMPLSFLLNGDQGIHSFRWLRRTLRPGQLIYMGPRDLDGGERALIEDLGIQWYSSEDINSFGVEALLKHALRIADPSGRCPLHLSFDVDVFDAPDVVATGTRVAQGPLKSEIMKLGRLVGQTGRLRSMDLVEVNPELCHETQTRETLELARRFTLSVTAPMFPPRPVQEPQLVLPSLKQLYPVSA